MQRFSNMQSLARRVTCLLAAITLLVSINADRINAADKIEAKAGKVYKLTDKHGPWMIKVASLWEEPNHREEIVLNALVLKLRKAGIPAYIHRQKEEVEKFEMVDRSGKPRQRSLTSQHSMVAVLAGNYEKPDDKVAKKTLAYIQKKFKAEVAVEINGSKETVPLVVRTAFMTRNPLLPQEEVSPRVTDPLLLSLNSGIEHTLFENKGNFTLVVASFYGQSKIKQAEFSQFDKALEDEAKVSLDRAARESWDLMMTLRKLKFPAYVYHDQFRSIVTIGEFKSANDPRIQELVERFRAKPDLDPKTGRPLFDNNGNPLYLPVNIQFDIDELPVLVDRPNHAEGAPRPVENGNYGILKLKRKNRVGTGWMMDVAPELMAVPKR